jgi:hypothetical protein
VNDLQGAQFALIDDATGQPVATGTSSGDPRSVYFTNDIPNARCTYTNNVARGVWAFANAPVNEPGNTHSYTLVMSGRMYESQTAPVKVGSAPAQLYAGSGSLMRPYDLSGPPPNVPDGG